MAADWASAQGAYDSDLQNAASRSLTSAAKPLGQLTNFVGAAVSVALIAGIGVWGYKLFIRDVSGIPVVRAVEGAMRIAPKDPGGAQADHQGLAVNSVAAEGSAEAPADRLVLAPRPVDLAAEDTPVLASGAVDAVPDVAEEQQPEAIARSDADETQAPAALTEQEAQARSIEALVAELTNGVEPLSNVPPTAGSPVVTSVAEVAAEPEAEAEEITSAVAETVEPDVDDASGIQNSLRPKPRPTQSQLENVVQVAAVATSLEPLDADSIAPGTRMVQLGAFESEEVAKSEWGRLTGNFSDYMEDKQSVIQRASSGGRIFYRLRAVGFEDLSDARRFCSALVAEKADCIPVIAR
ncbi:SPOR domain-containing protein [Sulfitobacter sp. JL08]|uniref:SPOR domain-containing protein n=1 Tax=Sulfitobacter sp. JL08 TaxID=2070369 RepID=UPI000E0AFEA7|nr:SPOR domain-containing protein [Sulfitobacter sp. JL08]AXI55213.1 SPOR domain-containing protein [Sulfitobacter sp. JL08]